MRTNTFFGNSDADFYSENNNVSIPTLTYQKYKKSKKRYYRLCSNWAPFCAKHWQYLCAIPYVINFKYVLFLRHTL
jgi:hypothetical protein